jgi:hypothetical protein
MLASRAAAEPTLASTRAATARPRAGEGFRRASSFFQDMMHLHID